MPQSEQPELARLTVELLSAYVTNNTVASSELPGLIEATRTALVGGKQTPDEQEPVFTPAVSVADSLASPDHILSLIDGKAYKALKRHLTNNGLTPEEYKARYNLPADYPLVAPSYSERRRAVARTIGLGGSQSKLSKASKAPALTATPAVEDRPAANSSDKVSGKTAVAGRRTAKIPRSTKKVHDAKAASSPTVETAVPVAPRDAAPIAPAAKAAKDSGSGAKSRGAKPKARQQAKTKSPIQIARKAAAPKTDPAGTVPGAAPEALVTSPAAAKPARKMARPKTEASAAEDAPAAEAVSPVATKTRKKLGLRFMEAALAGAAPEPAQASSSVPVSPKAGRKTVTRIKGSALKAPKAAAISLGDAPAKPDEPAASDA